MAETLIPLLRSLASEPSDDLLRQVRTLLPTFDSVDELQRVGAVLWDQLWEVDVETMILVLRRWVALDPGSREARETLGSYLLQHGPDWDAEANRLLGGIQDVSGMKSLQERWSSVFRSTDPFGDPFQPPLAARRVFYATDGYRLTDEQYAAVVAAARAVEEREFFVSIVEHEAGLQPNEHWRCALPTYAAYAALPLSLENALYGAQWGVLISHEDHAVIAGSPAFLAALDAAYTHFERDRAELNAFWADNPNRGWLDALSLE